MNVTEHKPKRKQRDPLSPTDMQQAIREETFSAPQFVYPLAIGGGLAFVAWALGMDTMGWTVLSLGLGAMLGAGGWAALRQFLWRDRLVYERMMAYQQDMLRQIEDKRARLREDLASLDDGRGLRQLDNLTAKFKLVTKRLRERFDPAEMTFVRYVSTAEQVYLGALDNLRTVVESSEALGTMKRDELVALRDERHRTGHTADADIIHERIKTYDRYQSRIQVALSDNEAALTRLSQVLEALMSLDTGQGMAKAPLDRAMQELAVLAQRTNEYET